MLTSERLESVGAKMTLEDVAKIDPTLRGDIVLDSNWRAQYIYWVADKRNPFGFEQRHLCLCCGHTKSLIVHPNRVCCFKCADAEEKVQKDLIAGGAKCTCRNCGKERVNGFDYGSGKYIAGERVGLCCDCLSKAADRVSDVIKTVGPAGLVTVMDFGPFSDEVDDLIMGKRGADWRQLLRGQK